MIGGGNRQSCPPPNPTPNFADPVTPQVATQILATALQALCSRLGGLDIQAFATAANLPLAGDAAAGNAGMWRTGTGVTVPALTRPATAGGQYRSVGSQTDSDTPSVRSEESEEDVHQTLDHVSPVANPALPAQRRRRTNAPFLNERRPRCRKALQEWKLSFSDEKGKNPEDFLRRLKSFRRSEEYSD